MIAIYWVVPRSFNAQPIQAQSSHSLELQLEPFGLDSPQSLTLPQLLCLPRSRPSHLYHYHRLGQLPLPFSILPPSPGQSLCSSEPSSIPIAATRNKLSCVRTSALLILLLSVARSCSWFPLSPSHNKTRRRSSSFRDPKPSSLLSELLLQQASSHYSVRLGKLGYLFIKSTLKSTIRILAAIDSSDLSAIPGLSRRH